MKITMEFWPLISLLYAVASFAAGIYFFLFLQRTGKIRLSNTIIRVFTSIGFCGLLQICLAIVFFFNVTNLGPALSLSLWPVLLFLPVPLAVIHYLISRKKPVTRVTNVLAGMGILFLFPFWMLIFLYFVYQLNQNQKLA